MNDAQTIARLPYALAMLRLGIAAVIIPWAIDKLAYPNHTAAVFRAFYGLSGVETSLLVVAGGLQLVVAIGFLLGAFRFWTYGAVLVMHTASTLASWRQYLDPYEPGNLLFFAAWPMLSACIVLFMFRHRDRFLSLELG